MNFVSVEFFALLGMTLFLLLVVHHRLHNIILLTASYIFYGWWNWRYLPLIIGLSIIDYVCGLAMVDRRNNERKAILVVALSANLLILSYFKYIDLVISSGNSIIAWLNMSIALPLQNVLLPIAISFHTFQSMSYAIDVYRGRTKPVRNLIDYQLFVSLFPMLVAGPIERAAHLLPQVQSVRTIRQHQIAAGLTLMLLGFFKKVVIADNLAPIVDSAFNDKTGGGLAIIIATYAFAFQIYADFSGYTDIARGTASLLGFDLIENFRRPYFAVNPGDFWRRWHISLSTWLRDYLYVPLGGNRHGHLRTYFALGLTMVLGGLWHGASWTFVLWGVFHGALLICHRLLFKRRVPSHQGSDDLGLTPARVLKAAIFFQFTCIGWLIFRAQGFDNLHDILVRLGRLDGWTDVSTLNVGLVAICAVTMFCIDAWHAIRFRVFIPLWFKLAAFLLMIVAIIVLAPENMNRFIYFQF